MSNTRAQPRPHADKLTQASEFRAALVAACRLSGKGFLLRAGLNGLPRSRLGLIASRKAARRAVDRNRAKRLARVAFNAARPQLPCVDVLLQLKNDLRQTGNPQIRKELDKLLCDMAARFGAPPAPSTLAPHPQPRAG